MPIAACRKRLKMFKDIQKIIRQNHWNLFGLKFFPYIYYEEFWASLKHKITHHQKKVEKVECKGTNGAGNTNSIIESR